MELLRECSLLKIDDILPFFPDFVTIDHFKVCVLISVRDARFGTVFLTSVDLGVYWAVVCVCVCVCVCV